MGGHDLQNLKSGQFEPAFHHDFTIKNHVQPRCFSPKDLQKRPPTRKHQNMQLAM
jgi:hypothetical protein